MPVIPASDTYATGIVPLGLSGPLSPYSVVIPGITKARAVGFMMSIVTAIIMVSIRPACARVSGASSRALTRIREAMAALGGACRGNSP